MFTLMSHIRTAVAVAVMVGSLIATGNTEGRATQETSARQNSVALPPPGGGVAPQGPYFQIELPIQLNQIFVGANSFTVPAGKELVIEYVSASGIVPFGESLMYSVSIGNVQHFIPATQQAVNIYELIFVAGQQTRLYADPGSTVTVGAIRTGSAGTASANISISGTLVAIQ